MKDADVVIKKQDELILNVANALESERTQNDALSKAVVDLKNENDHMFTSNLYWTGGAGLVGLIIGILVTK